MTNTTRTTQSQIIKPALVALLALVGSNPEKVVSTREFLAAVREKIEPMLTDADREPLESNPSQRRIDQVVRNLVSNKALGGYMTVVNGKVSFTKHGFETAVAESQDKKQNERRTLQPDVVKASLIVAQRIFSRTHRNVIKSDELREGVLAELEPILSQKDKEMLPSAPKVRRIDQVVRNVISSNRVLDKLGFTVYDNMTRKLTVNRRKVTAALKPA